MQILSVRESLDGGDLRALGLDREHEARADRLSVADDGTGPANAVLAAHMGAGEVQLLAQEIGEQHAWLGLTAARRAVDAKLVPVCDTVGQ